ncbi:hypothetical protein [Streptomyces sp. NPDC003710]
MATSKKGWKTSLPVEAVEAVKTVEAVEAVETRRKDSSRVSPMRHAH